MIPAEIWRRNSKNVTKLITHKKRIKTVELDPHHQTADANYNNNTFPPTLRSSRIELYKSSFTRSNMMAEMMVELKSEEKDGSDDSEKSVPIEGTNSEAGEKESKKKLNKKESNSLRKTLEKLLSRD